jgi:hypothetical protein
MKTYHAGKGKWSQQDKCHDQNNLWDTLQLPRNQHQRSQDSTNNAHTCTFHQSHQVDSYNCWGTAHLHNTIKRENNLGLQVNRKRKWSKQFSFEAKLTALTSCAIVPWVTYTKGFVALPKAIACRIVMRWTKRLCKQ